MPGRRSCPKDSPWGISGPVPQRGWRSTIPGSFMPRCRTHWSSDRPARRSASRSRIPAAPAPERSRSEAALPLPHAAVAASTAAAAALDSAPRRSYDSMMPMWRCPHCGVPQPETSRCWVCHRSSTSCGTCRDFRHAVVARIGYCGNDRGRAALTGDEIRPCWEPAAPDLADAQRERGVDVVRPMLPLMASLWLDEG